MGTMMRRAVVLFTGDPRREERRKSLPVRFLSTLHRQLIETVSHTDVSLIIASEVDGKFLLSLGDRVEQHSLSPQLGEKIDLAYRFAFGLGFDSVALLAGDVAGVCSDDLHHAFAALEGPAERSVLGRSRDGGFYLLGLNRAAATQQAIDWNAIPWFTGATSDTLASLLSGLGWSLLHLRRIDDIDSFADGVRITGQLSTAFATLRARLLSLLSDHLAVPDSLGPIPSAHLFEIALLRAPPLS